MKILLDENLPTALGSKLDGHQVSHVKSLRISGTRNGELIAFAREAFDCLITLDRGILHQHSFVECPLILFVLRVPDARVSSILARSDALNKALSTSKSGEKREIGLDE